MERGVGRCTGWGKMEFQVAMRSDTEGRATGSLLSAPRMLSLNASVPRHPARRLLRDEASVCDCELLTSRCEAEGNRSSRIRNQP